jgi:hypothetical protein
MRDEQGLYSKLDEISGDGRKVDSALYAGAS